SLIIMVAGLATRAAFAGPPPRNPPAQPGNEAGEKRPATVVQPKPLTSAAEKGLAYLVTQQQADGGWGQGGGWRNSLQSGGRVEGAEVLDPTDVGNTCIATLALVRAGHTSREGKYA